MKWLAEQHGEVRFKRWLDKNASEVLAEVGVRARQVVLDFGCGLAHTRFEPQSCMHAIAPCSTLMNRVYCKHRHKSRLPILLLCHEFNCHLRGICFQILSKRFRVNGPYPN